MKKFCRVCSSNCAVLIPILQNESLIKQLDTVLHISISEEDDLPTSICNSCKEIVECMYEFHDHVYNTQKYYAASSMTVGAKIQYREWTPCRLCRCSYDDFTDLAGDNDTLVTLSKLFKITLTQNNLPTIICKPCKDTVVYNWMLYVNAKKSQVILFDKLNELEEDDDDDEEEDEGLEIIFNKLINGLNSAEKQGILENAKERYKCDIPVDISDDDDGEDTYDSEETESIMDTKENEGDHAEMQECEESDDNELPAVSERIMYDCKQCERKFFYKDEFETHVSKHKADFRFYCICCRKMWPSVKAGRIHERRNFAQFLKPRKCEKCMKIFNSYEANLLHNSLYGKYHSFKCERCFQSFVDEEDYEAHRNAHTINFSHSCRICKQDFTTLAGLVNHEMTHRRHLSPMKKKSFQCVVCGSASSNKLQTETHLTTHTFHHSVRSLEILPTMINQSIIFC